MRKFKDIDLSFKVHPISKDLVLATDATAIRNAVKYLCLYGPYDRPYEFGTQNAGLYEYLFSLENTRTMPSMIYTKLMNIIKTHENRVEPVDVSVTLSESDNGFEVSVHYIIVSTGLRDDVKFTVVRTS